jgi:type IV pilus assembly protein PilE
MRRPASNPWRIKKKESEMRARSGFTLIEMMVVMAIMGILGAIAYPSYGEYITRTRRIEGQMALIDGMQQQERFYTRHNSYIAFGADSSDPDAKAFKWYSGSKPAHSAYELRGQACPGQSIVQCVELRAMPGTERVDPKFRDIECETLTLSSVGLQGASGKSGRCWP